MRAGEGAGTFSGWDQAPATPTNPLRRRGSWPPAAHPRARRRHGHPRNPAAPAPAPAMDLAEPEPRLSATRTAAIENCRSRNFPIDAPAILRPDPRIDAPAPDAGGTGRFAAPGPPLSGRPRCVPAMSSASVRGPSFPRLPGLPTMTRTGTSFPSPIRRPRRAICFIGPLRQADALARHAGAHTRWSEKKGAAQDSTIG